MKLIASLRETAERRVAYNRTIRALRAMPLDTALDLDIDRANAEKIAFNAVYGA